MKNTTLLKCIAASTAIIFGSVALAKTNSSFTDQQQKEIGTVVHDYLLQNPEVLIEVSKVLQKKQMDAAQSHALESILANKEPLFANSSDPVAGNPTGIVTIVEFFDYQCPHCVEMTSIIASAIKANSNLRIVYKEFPIFGDTSDFASRAALAANKQGKYLELHKGLMEAGKRLDRNSILEIAKNAGLDITKLQADMKGADIDTILKNNRTLAQQLQLVGTPAYITGPTDTRKMNASNISFIPGQTNEKGIQQAIDKA